MIEWKKIEDFENYEISNCGQIRRKLKRGDYKYLKPYAIHGGNKNDPLDIYLGIGLCKNGVRKRKKIHRLVAEAFIPTENKKLFVNHKDCDKRNNTVSNLEWMTVQQNTQHYYINKKFKEQDEIEKMREEAMGNYEEVV